jgi:hypothetical protein
MAYLTHAWRQHGLCLYCEQWCSACNQCKCDVKLLTRGQRRICPDRDMKKEHK